MKQIKVTENNIGKIQQELDSVQYRCTARTITVNALLEAMENSLSHIGIGKKAMDGCTVWIDLNAQNFPSAYKYIPESTQVNCLYHNGNWYINDIARHNCGRNGHVFEWNFTDAAKKAIIERFTVFAI